MEDKDERIQKLEQEIQAFDREQDKFVVLLEDELFSEEVQLKKEVENHEQQSISFLERLSVISGIIAPLSLSLLNFDFINKSILLISFSVFLINILIIQFVVRKYLNTKQRENINKIFELFDYSHLLIKHKLEKDIHKRMDIYERILSEHTKVRNNKKLLKYHGTPNLYIRIILMLLMFAVSMVLFSLVYESFIIFLSKII